MSVSLRTDIKAGRQIVRNLIRSRNANPKAPLKGDLPATDGPADGDLRDELRRAFAKLTPRAAEIFALRHIEGFTNPQIAQQLGISQVLVAVTLHRARRQLQKEIRSYRGGKA